MTTAGVITLNGERRDWPGPQSVERMLQDLGLDGRLVAVELNRLVVKRSRFTETLVRGGDEVEIVSFVGGG